MKFSFSYLLLLSITLNINAQTFKIGDYFYNDKHKFKLVGISTKDNSYTYASNTNTYPIIYGRKLDKQIISTIDNIIIRIIYLLIPEPKDIEVPTSIVKQIEKELMIKFGKNKFYGAILDGIKISVSRNNDAITSYEDRIMIFFALK